MITVFNRREVAVTMDMRRQADIRSALKDEGIPYAVRTKNLAGSGGARGRMGSFGMDMAAACEYKIYVRKEDAERALAIIRDIR